MEDKAAELVAQLLGLLRIVGDAETFGQLEECFFFLLAGFDSLLDEFHQNPMMLAFVESHPSQSARRMGHPARMLGRGAVLRHG